MKQKYFEKCGLILIDDEGKLRLYKVPEHEKGQPFQLKMMQCLSEPQTSVEVLPECNLIITQDALFTLDEQFVMQRESGKISVLPVENAWLILLDRSREDDHRYQLIFWNGKKVCGNLSGQKLVKNDDFFALYTKADKCWDVYNQTGKSVLHIEGVGSNVELCGHFLITHAVGNHAVYSLLTKCCLFSRQQLILCSAIDDFVICANLQGDIRTYYRGQHCRQNAAAFITMFDEAGLFCLRRYGKNFLYRFNGEAYARELYPEGVDMAAYDEENNSLLLADGGTYQLIDCA